MTFNLTRRGILAGAAVSVPTLAFAQAKPPVAPITSIMNGRVYGPDAPPNIYPDPDILILDPAANDCFIGHSSIKRVKTGFEWAEGPAWSAQGQYVVFSDVTKDIQYRYIWETGEITEYRRQSFNSNGNTFDFQGRQITAQHYLRRVIRWEHDGSMTIIADNYNGQPLNSPNDIAPHKDGSIWFTDPYYGAQLAEGHPDPGVAIFNPKGLANPNIGNGSAGIIGSQKQVRPPSIYRWDPSGRLDVILEGKPGLVPNGIAFSAPLHQLRCGWGALRPRWPPGGRGWQCLVGLDLCARLYGRDGMEPGRQMHRPHPAAGNLRQCHLLRPQAGLAVDVRLPVGLSGPIGYPRRGSCLNIDLPQCNIGTSRGKNSSVYG